LPYLKITKDGEAETITSPELSQAEAETQQALLQSVIDRLDPEHPEHTRISECVDLGWCQFASHVLKGAEIEEVE
jgi:hypothetical protein